MSPKAIAVAGLSAIAIAASGCTGDSDPEAEFRAAFEKKFSAAPWYHHITGLKMSPGRLEITTDLDAESAANETEIAGTICLAAVNVALDAEALDGGETAGVFGSDGAVLGNCA